MKLSVEDQRDIIRAARERFHYDAQFHMNVHEITDFAMKWFLPPHMSTPQQKDNFREACLFGVMLSLHMKEKDD